MRDENHLYEGCERSDGLLGVLEEHAVHADIARALDGDRRVVEEDTPAWPNAEPTACDYQPMRVCVIGAGFAGIAAAIELMDDGTDVTVFEARDRVGGRVWSQEMDNGAVIERGAEFVLHDYSFMRKMAGRLGLQLIPTGVSYGRREPWHSGTDVGEMQRGFDALRDLSRRRPNLETVGDVMDEAGLRDPVRAALVTRLSISCGHEAEALASSILGHSGSNISNEPSHRVEGGNDQLAMAGKKRLGDRLHLRTAVTAIAWRPDSVTVRGAGFEVDFDEAIVTVPAAVLDAISFDPPLPNGFASAVRDIAYGHAAKLFVPLASDAGTSAVMSVPGGYWCWTALGADGSTQPVLSCFAGSSTALDALDIAAGPQRWLDLVTELRLDLDLASDGAFLSTWDDDPWVGAAYTAEVAGHPRTDALSSPVGRLHFAGEHTAGQWAGTMEGALRSGSRAAAEVLRTT
jgi:monoamine oxidase